MASITSELFWHQLTPTPISHLRWFLNTLSDIKVSQSIVQTLQWFWLFLSKCLTGRRSGFNPVSVNAHSRFLSVLFCLLAGFVDSLQAADLTEIEKNYRAEYELNVGAKHTAAVAALDVKYLAALERSLKEATQNGRLEEALSLRDEIQRVKNKEALQETDADGIPALVVLRTIYLKELDDLVTARNRAAAPIVTKFEAAVTALQEKLTKAGNLDEALKVRAYREDGLTAILQGERITAQNSSTERIDLLAKDATLSGAMEAHGYGGGRIVQIGPNGSATWQSVKIAPGNYKVELAAGGLRSWEFGFRFSAGDAELEFDLKPNSNGFTVTKDFSVGTLTVVEPETACQLICLTRGDRAAANPLPGKEPGGHIESVSLIPTNFMAADSVSESARQTEQWLIGSTWEIDYGKGRNREHYYFLPDGNGCRRANGKITAFFGVHRWRTSVDGSVSFGLGFRKIVRLENSEKGTVVLFRGDSEEQYPFHKTENIPEMVMAARKAADQ